jgi:hypothetical protein
MFNSSETLTFYLMGNRYNFPETRNSTNICEERCCPQLQHTFNGKLMKLFFNFFGHSPWWGPRISNVLPMLPPKSPCREVVAFLNSSDHRRVSRKCGKIANIHVSSDDSKACLTTRRPLWYAFRLINPPREDAWYVGLCFSSHKRWIT